MSDPTDAPLFELDGVSLVIDGTTILDGIDLEIPARGITVLLGPSGAGKSMLLRLLNRLEVPTAGEVRFRGRPVQEIDPLELRRRVGMVFQRPTPFPGTVRENLLVAEPGATEDEMARVLRAARLDPEFLDRDADELSGGEAQRMCLARTLLTRPEVLLMDEPTSALDPEARRGLERTAQRIARRGRPMVWVTHDLEQAQRLADEVVVLVGGRVATPEQRARYLAGEWSGGNGAAGDAPAGTADAAGSGEGEAGTPGRGGEGGEAGG
ncbi:MAG: phosphate ABC transporter ATP-binding protein [Acidimicrobiia bacterium]|nr:phosphate ABC transporter ATP-binding protein [Thermoanaerobacterales bacterium]